MASKREHLRRLGPEAYRGDAVVHWSLTIRDRRTGWLTVPFYYRFRELLTHATFKYRLACPIYCCMPDHVHLLWMGLHETSDQKPAMKAFRKWVNASLKRIGYSLQDQPYDHVLTDDERKEDGFRTIWNYIARNPERAGLVPVDGYDRYGFTGCLLPGFPELRPFDDGYWNDFDKVVSHLRRNGLYRLPKGSGGTGPS